MNESQIERIRAQLQACKGTWPAIQLATGLSYFTIVRIATGKNANPTISTVAKIEGYFKAKRKSDGIRTKQCTSCGGICGKHCERENIK